MKSPWKTNARQQKNKNLSPKQPLQFIFFKTHVRGFAIGCGVGCAAINPIETKINICKLKGLKVFRSSNPFICAAYCLIKLPLFECMPSLIFIKYFPVINLLIFSCNGIEFGIVVCKTFLPSTSYTVTLSLFSLLVE